MTRFCKLPHILQLEHWAIPVTSHHSHRVIAVGVTLPKLGMFLAMDYLTVRSCRNLEGGYSSVTCPRSKNEADGVNACTALGGECVVVRDGFYPLAYGMAIIGLIMGLGFQRLLPELERRPLEAWRVRSYKQR